MQLTNGCPHLRRNSPVLLGSMEPALLAGTYVYCVVPHGADISALSPVATVSESEGLTLVLPAVSGATFTVTPNPSIKASLNSTGSAVPDEVKSKLNLCLGEIHKVWPCPIHTTTDDPGQAIFAGRVRRNGVPAAAAAPSAACGCRASGACSCRRPAGPRPGYCRPGN